MTGLLNEIDSDLQAAMGGDKTRESANPTEAPVQRKRRSPLMRWTLQVIRRSHLYFGLLLVPWALLYGISAYLFNHPTHFSSGRLLSLDRTAVAGTEIAEPADAMDAAHLVVAELNRRFQDRNLQLDPSVPPKFEGESVSLNFDSDGATYRAFLHLNGSGGIVSKTDPPKPIRKDASPYDVSPLGAKPRGGRPSPDSPASDAQETASTDPNSAPLTFESSIVERTKRSAETIFSKAGYWSDSSKLRITSVPELVFVAKDQEQAWTIKHNALTGAVTAVQAGAPKESEFSLRRYLLRLHTTHGYPTEYGARWFWAIVVDLMAFVMVFWGVSGIVMWWQIKATRPSGTIALAISLIAAVSLALQMYWFFAARGD